MNTDDMTAMTGIEIGAAERKRQIEVEGWAPEHDRQYTAGELALAGSSYACPPEAREMHERPVLEWSGGARHSDTYLRPSGRTLSVPVLWPWDVEWWRPGDGSRKGRIRELAKAIGLIAAEIDRLKAEERDAALAEAVRRESEAEG